MFQHAFISMPVLQGQREKLLVFGDDYPTPDGSGIRDYINVNDLVDGHVKAYKTIISSDLTPDPSPSRRGEDVRGSFKVYNLGTGRGISVLEMIKTVENVSGKDIPYQIVDRRSGDLAEVYGNADKAKKALGRSADTSLEESIRQMMGFYNIK